jgi:hypothetical protein
MNVKRGDQVNRTVLRIAVALGSVLAVLGLASCAGNHGPSAAAGRVVDYHPDYPGYDSVDSLYRAADLVVEVRIGGTTAVRALRQGAPDNDPRLNPAAGTGANATPDALVVTVYQASVTRVYKGGVAAGSTVPVKQLGGSYQGVTYREVGATALRPGGSYVLFLAVFPDAPASLLNPDQGQYAVGSGGAPATVGTNTLSLTSADLTRLSYTG